MLCLPLGVYIWAVSSWALGNPKFRLFFHVSVTRCVLSRSLVVSPWAFSPSLHVWQLTSWVTSSRDHLDIFSLGPRPETDPQGHHCCLLQPALLWAICVTAGQLSWPVPTRTQGLPSYGVQQGHSLGTYMVTIACQPNHPGSAEAGLSHREPTSN